MTESFYSRTGKRCIDAACALFGLIALSPLLFLAALAVKLTSQGPIFFTQPRAGQFGKTFSIIKLRTMRGNGAGGSLITAAGDPRITRLGKWLRKTKVDELPQLINVLMGDMSLVGPRPEVPSYTAGYTEKQKAIFLVKPGMTGPSVNLCEEELLAGQPDKESFYRTTILPAKLEIGIAYCESICFWGDLKSLFGTFWKILFGIPGICKPLQSAGGAGRAGTILRRELQTNRTDMEEVLGREGAAVLNFEGAVGATYRGRRILVTGAGGSIGSELVRQLSRLAPVQIAILDKDENSIYELEQEIRLRKSAATVEPQIADIRDAGRLRAIFLDFRPDVVFHAAAHKHVPLMEMHPCEAVVNNVGGTKNVLDIGAETGIELFVFVSSDKAVNPVNVMGVTKRIGEMLVQASVNPGGMRSACVRFGNVLGSRGSVIPLFLKQIAAGGPVTVTHPDAARYFMTIREAVHLILCAGTMARDAEIFVPDMGNPRNILELAREMIRLSGLEPGKDMETIITGLRPGERLREELVAPWERLLHTRFDKLSVIRPQPCDQGALLDHIAELLRTAKNNDDHRVREMLHAMSLSYEPRELRASAVAASD